MDINQIHSLKSLLIKTMITMKKVYLLAVSLVVAICLNAQQLTGLQVVEVLASDDFEDDTPWVNFDSPDFNHSLNNALGGTQAYNWSDAWGGACVHEGKSATAGKNCVQLHWGGSLILQGFEIDAEKVYQLEVMVHPLGGVSDSWNNWGAIHLFVFDSSNVWQTQGMRVRVSNNGEGESPARLAYDVWTGDNGDESFRDLLNFADQWAAYTIDDANDGTPGFWIPLKLVFKGEGTVASPFIIDFYMNDKFVETATITDLVWKGDAMIALQNGADNSDVCRYDNFKLSLLGGGGSGIESTNVKKLTAIQNAIGELEVTSDVFGEGVVYTLYNIAGNTAVQGKLIDATTNVSVEGLVSGVYLLQVRDNESGASNTIRAIVK